ncbi:putative methionine adenosyltransferase regulator [Trypoxylus dichotomus]
MLKHVVTGKRRHKDVSHDGDCEPPKYDEFPYSNSAFVCDCMMIRVVIDRTRGRPLGIKIVGGKRSGRGVYVSSILERGAVYENGTIEQGDEILAINDHPLGRTITLEGALMIIKKIKTPYVVIHVARTPFIDR